MLRLSRKNPQAFARKFLISGEKKGSKYREYLDCVSIHLPLEIIFNLFCDVYKRLNNYAHKSAP